MSTATGTPPSRAARFVDPNGYARHRPESTLLYRLVAQHWPAFRELRAAQGRPLPSYVEAEFEPFLRCGRLEHGFLRVACESCHAEKLVAFSCKKRGFCPSCGARRMAETAALLADDVLPRQPLRQWVLALPHALRYLLATKPDVLTQVLGVIYRTISGHLLRKAGLTRTTGDTGAVTLVQRFGSALNLNVHFHKIALDGAYRREAGRDPTFVPVPAPSPREVEELVRTVAERIGRLLERRGLVRRDVENAWLELEGPAGPLDDLIGHSITYRVAVGPRAGQKLYTLQTVPSREEGSDSPGWRRDAAQAGGFSLHAALEVGTDERDKLERLCRYVSRPPVALDRLTQTAAGLVRYRLKTPYRDGTTHVVLEPLDLIARLAALVPPPRTHLTRYHGVLAPHSALRAAVTPAQRGAGAASLALGGPDPPSSPRPRHEALTWARRLERVFGVEIETCARCGGRLRIVASIEEPAIIARILAHLERTAPELHSAEPSASPGARAPPLEPR